MALAKHARLVHDAPSKDLRLAKQSAPVDVKRPREPRRRSLEAGIRTCWRDRRGGINMSLGSNMGLGRLYRGLGKLLFQLPNAIPHVLDILRQTHFRWRRRTGRARPRRNEDMARGRRRAGSRVEGCDASRLLRRPEFGRSATIETLARGRKLGGRVLVDALLVLEAHAVAAGRFAIATDLAPPAERARADLFHRVSKYLSLLYKTMGWRRTWLVVFFSARGLRTRAWRSGRRKDAE